MTKARLFVAAFCVLCICVTARADHSFASALAQAHQNTKSEEGEKYDTAFGVSFVSRQADLLPQCTDGLPEKDLHPFDIVAQVAPDGSLESVLVGPQTKVAVCLREHILRSDYPTPPRAHYWVNIHIKVEP